MTAPVLPAPNFVDRDPAAITTALLSDFEARTGRPLRPAQVERILIDVIAYREQLLRLAMQEVGEQALLATARWPMLDWHADSYGVTRLEPTPAVAMLRVTLSAAQLSDVTIPAGVRVRSADGLVTLVTTVDAVIAAGALTGDVLGEAIVAGASANGYVPGAIATLLDPQALVVSIQNTETTAGGAEREGDESLRTRVRDAHVRTSTAGSVSGYRWHALSASPSVIDANVTSPAPGQVQVAILSNTGTPSPELLTLVTDALSAESVRPITDQVTVVSATRVTFVITATLRRYVGTDGPSVIAAAAAAAATYASDRRTQLGRDVVPSQIVALLSVPGVYDVTLTAPALLTLAVGEWADATAITITDGGTVVG